MARYRHWRCPDCSGVFKELHVLSDDPPPDRCPICGAWMNVDNPPDEAFVPQAPAIKKSEYVKSVDQSFRAMESASIERANEAAGILETEYSKQPHDEFDSGLLRATQKDEIASLRSNLKITDMKDPSQMREGDSAAIMPPVASSPVAANPTGFQSMVGGMPNFAPGVGGHQPGATAASNITRDHHSRAMSMIRAGRLNPQ